VAQNQQANVDFFCGKENWNHELGTDFVLYARECFLQLRE
jgi:hypothetical protein